MKPYEQGECTWYAAKTWKERFNSDALYFDPLTSGRHARNWQTIAQAQGLAFSALPMEGGVVIWKKIKPYGHVAIIEKVNEDGTYDISESNWDGPGVWGERKHLPVDIEDVFLAPPQKPVDPEFQEAWNEMLTIGVYSEFTKPGDVVTTDRLAVFLHRFSKLPDDLPIPPPPTV